VSRLTAERVRAALHYEPCTGVLTWREDRGSIAEGQVAGCLTSEGYICIQLDSKKYQAHRLAWLSTYGEWPPEQLDHTNGVRTDNRIVNRRAVSATGNGQNQAMPASNTSGVLGVSWVPAKNKWRAQIRVDGRVQHIGLFTNKEDAALARLSASTKHGYHPNHGRSKT